MQQRGKKTQLKQQRDTNEENENAELPLVVLKVLWKF